MSNKTYFITLTPHQLFFFGTEQGQTADYFVKGSFLPQQTALLGLVRHQVLLQNDLMQNNKITDDTEASKWIGGKSFEYDKENDFGKIKSVSPCYLVKKDGDEAKTKLLPFHQSYCKNLKRLSANFFLPEYDPKQYYHDVWLSLDKTKSVCNSDCMIYEEVTKPGVDKNYNGKTEEDDNAFYKQVWLKMKKGFSFGFYIVIKDDVTFKTAEVNFGKESAPFQMEVLQTQNTEVFDDEENPTALMLTSDTYSVDNILNLTDFAVTDTVPFRNIVNTTSKNTPYYSFDNRLSRKSTVRLQLYKRGSIFFATREKLEQIKTAIDEQTSFKNIGFNHYHLLNISY